VSPVRPQQDPRHTADSAESNLMYWGFNENHGAQGRNRTTDTVIFSHVLYQLSYLGAGRAGKLPAEAPRYRDWARQCPAARPGWSERRDQDAASPIGAECRRCERDAAQSSGSRSASAASGASSVSATGMA
jgi:hypothetical protein